MAVDTFVRKVQISGNTIVRKIRVGTPIRRVIGAQPQTLDDLLDVRVSNAEDGQILQYHAAEKQWLNVSYIAGGTF